MSREILPHRFSDNVADGSVYSRCSRELRESQIQRLVNANWRQGEDELFRHFASTGHERVFFGCRPLAGLLGESQSAFAGFFVGNIFGNASRTCHGTPRLVQL